MPPDEELSQEEMDYLQQMMLLQYMMGPSGLGPGFIPPPVDRYGNPEPIEPSDISSQGNALYKVFQNATNPLLINFLAPELLPAEDPAGGIVNESEVQMVGQQMLNDALQRPNTVTGIAAQLMTGPDPLDEIGVMAELQNLYENGQLEANGVRLPMKDERGQRTPDWSSIQSSIGRMFRAVREDPLYDDERPVYDAEGNQVGSRYFRIEQELSDRQKMDRALGLSPPGETYTPDFFETDRYQQAAVESAQNAQNVQMINQLLGDIQAEDDRAAAARIVRDFDWTSFAPPQEDNKGAYREFGDFMGRNVGDPIRNFLGAQHLEGSLGPSFNHESLGGQPSMPPLQERSGIGGFWRRGLDRRAQIAQNQRDVARARLEGQKRTAQRQMRDTVRNRRSRQGMSDAYRARAEAYNARQQGRTPRGDQTSQLLAMLSYLGVGR